MPLLAAARFWLERGVDGFRLDTINFYFHDKQLRNNPGLPPERRNANTAPAVNPYNYQEHLYDKNRPENLEFLKRFRAAAGRVSRTLPPLAKSATRSAVWKSPANIPPAMTRCRCATPSSFLAPEALTPARVAEVAARLHGRSA